jgi:hypothetical protein
MVEGTCECGAVRVELETAPETVGTNVDLLALGALWAYYRTSKVRVTGETTIYLRRNRHIEFHHRAVCR